MGNRTGIKGQWLRERLEALPVGQPIELYWLADDFGRACFTHLPDPVRTRTAEKHILSFFDGPLPRQASGNHKPCLAWSWREGEILAKLHGPTGTVLVWLPRTELGRILAES